MSHDYNAILARVTGWGSAAIGVPILAFLSFTLHDEPGQLRLVIQAPETARDGADAAFAPFRSKAAASPACGCRAGASA